MSRRPSGFNLMDRLKSIEQSKKKRRRSSSDRRRKKTTRGQTKRSGTNQSKATVTSELLKFPHDIGELIGDQQRKSYIKKGRRPLPKNVRKQMKRSQFDQIMRQGGDKARELQKLFMMSGIEFIPEEKPKASKRRKKTRHRKKHSKKHRKKSRKKHSKKHSIRRHTKHR